MNTAWDVVITANSWQSFTAVHTFNFGATNSSNLQNNQVQGQTVVPSSQIYFTIEPLQPYATVTLVPAQELYVSGATGYGNILPNNGVALNAQSISTSGQSLTYYTPVSSVWHVYEPVEITIQKSGGDQPFSPITVIVNASQGGTYTFKNPQNSSQTLTITGLGNLAGDISLPSLNDPVFFASNGSPNINSQNFEGFNNGLNAIAGFQNYWFGSSTNFAFSNGETMPQPDQNYWPGSSVPTLSAGSTQNVTASCQATVHPGWQQEIVSALPYYPSGLVYYYAPVQPQIGPSSPQSTIYGELPNVQHPSYKTTTQTCLGLGLTSWLTYDGVTQYNSNPYGLGNWGSINSTMLVENLPYSSLDFVQTPELSFLIGTQLADTIIYQQNNAQFKITAAGTSQSTVQAGASTTITVSVEDASSFPGTATIQAGVTAPVSVSPPSQSLNLSPGQTQSLTFTATGLQTTTENCQNVNFNAVNSIGQVTSSDSVGICVIPQPTGGNPDFVIVSVSPTGLQLSQGQSATLNLNLKNLGGSGSASITAISSAPGLVTVVQNQNQTFYLGSDSTGTANVAIYAATQPQKATSATITFTVQSTGGGVTSTTLTVEILPSSVCGSLCSTSGSTPYLLYIIIGVVIVAVGVSSYFILRKRSEDGSITGM